MENNKIETYLGFCIRSGKIIFGTEMISRQKKGVKLLISDGGMGTNSFKIMVTLGIRLVVRCCKRIAVCWARWYIVLQ